MIQKHDSTVQLNQADTWTLIAQANAADSWQQPVSSPVPPIHAALLRTGKVLLIAGSATNQQVFQQNCPDCSAVWNVNNNTFTRPTTPLDNAGNRIDLFCAGHSFRADGRLMVAGGTGGYNPYRGINAALLFNPTTEQWTKVASMNGSRWYPTLITLGNNRVLALSGLNAEGSNLDTNPEVYGTSSWIAYSKPTLSRFPMYSQLFLMSNGKLFFSGASFNEDDNVVTPRILTLPSTFTQQITEQEVPGLGNPEQRNSGTSVLLPPAQDQKVMVIGGGTKNTFGGQATNTVYIVDLKANNPSYQVGPSLYNPRMHVSAVLLPDRTVFVCGGSRVGEDVNQSKLPSEIYNPVTNTWTLAAAQTVAHVYHSWALLLPDGRVAAGGSTPGLATNYLELEIYSPAYMSQPRPIIQQAPTLMKYGQTVTIQTAQAQNIKWVHLIKPSATTHHCDTEQRLVDLPINSVTANSLSVTVTNNPNIAPPAYYMLFLTDKNNVPSVASWIQLS